MDTKNSIITKDSIEIISENYINYSKYVIETRAYPSIVDGCKSAHRRCIHCCYKYLPRHLVKSAEAVGKITVLHPHPQSIYAVLVSMASKYDCRFPLFDTKGNFGGMSFPCAAERYTELMLSDLAIKIFEPFADYVDMVQGEMNTDEPYALATLLPLCFLHGTYGISTGLSNVRIPALNPVDLIKYYIKVLESKDINTIPDIIVKPNMGGVSAVITKKEWNELLQTGEGKVKYIPNIIKETRKLTITAVHSSKNIENIFKVLTTEINTDKIDVRDESTDHIRYVIEAVPRKQVNMTDVYNKVFNELSVTETYSFIFADSGNAVFCGLPEVVKRNLEYLIKACKRKLSTEIGQLKYKLSVLEVIQKLKKDNDNLHKLFNMTNDKAIEFLSKNYDITEEQAKSVLSKPISYLTKEHMNEITDLKNEIKELNKQNQDIFEYLITLYNDLLKDVKSFIKYQETTKMIFK